MTDGRCHLTGRKLAFKNYGNFGERGAWEVDHSNPRARGGTDRRSNLLPAAISPNRSKQDRSTRAVRGEYGLTRKPMSRREQGNARAENAAIGGVLGLAAGTLFRAHPVGMLGGLLIGALIGHSADPE